MKSSRRVCESNKTDKILTLREDVARLEGVIEGKNEQIKLLKELIKGNPNENQNR